MTRKPDDWMPLHIGEYLADTTHLTRDQHGAYLLLIMAYWRRGEALPADDGQLAAMAKATPAEWRKMRPIISALFRETDGKWFQKRCEEELTKARAVMAAKSAAGKKGAENRWQAHGEGNGTAIAEASNSQRQNDGPLPSPSPKPEGNKQDCALTRFEEFWNFCPKKTGRGAAEKAWLKALTLTDADTLIHAIGAYATQQAGKDLVFVKSPALWLADKRWTDEGLAPREMPTLEQLREQRAGLARMGYPTTKLDRAIQEAEAQAA